MMSPIVGEFIVVNVKWTPTAGLILRPPMEVSPFTFQEASENHMESLELRRPKKDNAIHERVGNTKSFTQSMR